MSARSTDHNDPNRDAPTGAFSVSADLLAEIIRRIVEVAQPDRIILFGSVARGEADPDSDIDLLIIKSGVAHRTRLAQRIHQRMFGIPVAVDVVVVSPEDVERYGGGVGSVIRPALLEGRELYAA